jgi:signal transduction histidine kinase
MAIGSLAFRGYRYLWLNLGCEIIAFYLVDRTMPSPDLAAKPRRFNFERWLWSWHVLTYLALAIGLVSALSRPAPKTIPILLLSVLFAGWYTVCIVTKYAVFKRSLLLMLAYLGIGWGIWFWLTTYDMIFMTVLVGLYPQVFGLPPTPWKIVGAVILTVLTVWRQTSVMGFVSWAYLTVALVTLAAAIALGLFIDAVVRQSEERRQLIEELQAARSSLAAAERQAGALEERQRLAREIHDTLAQGFTSIIMHLETVEAALDSDPGGVRKGIGQVRSVARESLAEARRMVWALQPESLEHASLSEAIKRLASRWMEETGVQAEANITGRPHRLPAEIEVTVLRSAQEALVNIRKHAWANRVALTLSYMDDLIALDVHDDGMGFEPDLAPEAPDSESLGGFGLRAMRERVEAQGGTFSVESAVGEGTTIAVALPVFADPQQAAEMEQRH